MVDGLNHQTSNSTFSARLTWASGLCHNVEGLLIDRAGVTQSCEPIQQAVANWCPGHLQRLAAEPDVGMRELALSYPCPHRRI